MPAARRAWIGLSSGLATFVLSALFLAWRRRLRHVRAQQAQAEIELKAYASKLEFDSATKSYLSEVSNELHQAESLAAFARTFIYRLAPRIAADYAAFYALDEASQRLIPVGGHGASPQDLLPVDWGQGLIGQCAKDMTPIAISGAADSAARIVWGQGAVAAKAILYLPVHQAGRLLGVIVLAALRDFDAEKRTLLDAMLPMLAMNLEILSRNLGTQQQAAAIRQAAQRLADQLAFQQLLIDTIPYPIFYKGADTRFLGFNRAYEQAFAIKREALIGKRVLDLDYLPAAERTAYQAEDERVIAEASTVQREMPMPFADGKIHDTLYFVSGFRLSDGSPGGLVGTFIDVSERRKVEDLERLIDERTQKLEKTAAGVGQLVALLSEFKSDAAQECLLEIARDLDIRS
jgi:PAS domain S-box-containing protein